MSGVRYMLLYTPEPTDCGCVSKTWLSYYHITFSVMVTGAPLTLLTTSGTEYKQRLLALWSKICPVGLFFENVEFGHVLL